MTITRLETSWQDDLTLDVSVSGARETVSAANSNALWLSDGSLQAALAALVGTHSSGPTATVSTDTQGRIVVTATGLVVHGGSDLATALGWDDGDESATASRVPRLEWAPGVEPSDDSAPRQRLLRGRSETWGGDVVTTDWGSQSDRRDLLWELLPVSLALPASADVTATAWEDWDRYASRGWQTRLFDRYGASDGIWRYRSDGRMERDSQWRLRWEVRIRLARVSAATVAPDVFVSLEYLWDARDVTDGAAWVDRVSGVSIPWAGRSDVTITAGRPTAGIADAAIGAARVDSAVRIQTSSVTGNGVWTAVSGDAALALADGESVWMRGLMRRLSASYDEAVLHFFLDYRDTGAANEIFRAIEYYPASRLGGGGGSVRASNSVTSTAIAEGSPDTRGLWCLYDVFYDGTTNELTAACNGKSASVTAGNVDAVTAGFMRLCIDANTDLVAMGMSLGSPEWSISQHNTDVVRLLGSIPA